MHTLPVKPWKHIVSKLFVSMLWMVLSGIIAFISTLVIALEKGGITEISVGLATFFRQAYEQFGASIYLLSFEVILGILVSLASLILIIFASIAMGHLFNQHKMLASFGAFILLSTLSQFLFTLIGLIPGIASFPNMHISSPHDFVAVQAVIQRAMAYGIMFTGLLCVAYFTVTNFILSKRLNLE